MRLSNNISGELSNRVGATCVAKTVMSQGPCLILLICLSTRLVNPIRFCSSIHEVRVRPEALILKSEFALPVALPLPSSPRFASQCTSIYHY